VENEGRGPSMTRTLSLQHVFPVMYFVFSRRELVLIYWTCLVKLVGFLLSIDVQANMLGFERQHNAHGLCGTQTVTQP